MTNREYENWLIGICIFFILFYIGFRAFVMKAIGNRGPSYARYENSHYCYKCYHNCSKTDEDKCGICWPHKDEEDEE